jgi:hypothetical protein
VKQAILSLLYILAVFSSSAVFAQNERLPDVIYMDQPTGIDLSTYLATWPSLQPYIARLSASPHSAVEADLKLQVESQSVYDGELNLLAQLEWRRGELDLADTAVARAVALRPRQSLNAFQQAMVNFAHLRRASGMLEQWKWQQRTRDAYQRTFDLDPRNVSARYYLAYSYMNTPWIGGGDKKKALQLSEGGISSDQIGFYVVRADAHRLSKELDAANADYDTSIKLKVFKLSSFVDAAHEELERKQLARAKQYLDWAVHCRPDSTKAYEGLGDYYSAVNEREQAKTSYEISIKKDSDNQSARKKLSQLLGR